MKKLFLTAALLTITSGAAYAGHHEGAKADTDGDGFISKAEFLAKKEANFAKMDTNGDGKLSKEEMKEKRSEMRDKMKNKMEKHSEEKSY